MAGFGFCPTDADLLTYFLKPKINGEAISCNFIVEKQIYGPNCNPWDVLDDYSTPWIPSGESKRIAYVFTRLNNQGSSVVGSPGSDVWKNYVKLGGCGSWNGITSRVSISDNNNNNVLGFRREFIFQISDVNATVRNNLDVNKLGHYKLHEYVLSGCDDYALCLITLDTSKIPMVFNDVFRVLGKRKSQYYGSTPTKMLCM